MQQVLLIDDDPVVTRSVVALLEQAGVLAMTASTAAEGLRKIYVHHTELIFVLLDIGLPDGNGYDVARAVRADPFMIDLPFVVITAHLEQDTARQAALLNIEDILYKPVSFAEISAVVDRYRRDE